MQWLNQIVEEIISRFPDGDLLIESGSAPSGIYHVGHLREVITCDAIVLVLQKKGRNAKHIHFVDDLDAFRKVPVNIPETYSEFLGKPLCDFPSPIDPNKSYGDYYLDGLKEATVYLGIELDYMYSHEKYRSGFFVTAIEKCFENSDKIKEILDAYHKENWMKIGIRCR